MTDQQTPETAPDPLMEPTNEYSMRFAANRIAEYARKHPELAGNEDEYDAINGAYQQLLRGANTLRAAQDGNALGNSRQQ